MARALSVCACTGCVFCHPRCARLVERGRCDGCKRAARRASDRRRPTARQRGYDARWEQARLHYLLDHPTCEWPDCNEPAVDVDHEDGLGPSGPRGRDQANLRGFCHSHHSKRTARDQPGGWAAR